MKFKMTILSTCLLIRLFACQQSQKSSDSAKKAILTLTMGGNTKTYTDASISEGKPDSIVTIGITAGSTVDDYLSLTAFGDKAGAYPYKQDIGNYTQVSQVEYKVNGTAFNNYFMQICPDKSGYSSSKGEIKTGKRQPGYKSPPETVIRSPVTQPASSEARNTATFAMSSG